MAHSNSYRENWHGFNKFTVAHINRLFSVHVCLGLTLAWVQALGHLL